MNTTADHSALIRATVYSEMLMENIHAGMLPDGLHRDVSDFPDGTSLQIPTIGDVVIHDLQEDKPAPLTKADSGYVTLNITEYQGTGWYFSDELKEDSYKAAQMDASIMQAANDALKRAYETKLLATFNGAQTAGSVNAFNRGAHRICASGGAGARTLTFADFVYLNLAFNKAELPEEGRILIVPAIAAASIESNFVSTAQVGYNIKWEGVAESGFVRGHRFVRNIMGFDVYVSERLPVLTAAETLDTTPASVITAPSASDVAEIGDIGCLALVAGNDNVTPLMGAWRRMPKMEGKREASLRRDEFYLSTRYGFGVQRPQSGAVVFVNPSTY